jgi:alpha-glucosidase
VKLYHYFAKVESFTPVKGGLIFHGQNQHVQVTFAGPGILLVDYNPLGDHFSSWAVIEEDQGEAEVQVTLGEQITMTWGDYKAVINQDPFSIEFWDEQGLLTSDVPGQGWGYCQQGLINRRLIQAQDHFYGFGEKMGHIDKRGRRMTMWNADVVPHMPSTDPLYQSIPFYITFNRGRAWGYFLDNTHRTSFNMGKSQPSQALVEADGGRLRCYLLGGPTIAEVLARYSKLTGTLPLPPKWALGYQQCRYSYHPDSQVLEIAQTLRAKEIPCDVIYLDIHYMDGFRVFSFDPREFSAPGELMKELEALGFKTVVIVDPGVKVDENYEVFRQGVAGGHFTTYPNGDIYQGDVWPGPSAFPDFLKEAAREWWGDLHKFYLDYGVAGIWNDMNEPAVFNWPGKTMPSHVTHGPGGCYSHERVHNVYALEMAKATYQGLTRLKPQERPFVLTRAGFAGIQRYSAVWLGDNSSWWEHLAAVIPMCLGMGLSGVAFVGTDIGGFVDDCQPELLARWTQLGALIPFCRNHSAVDTRHQEPWVFGTEIEDICRDYIRLRYRLLPYLYNLFRQASLTGLPLWRPLVMNYPQDPMTWRLDDQCLVGDDILVAPVTQPGANQRLVYLPQGEWYNWHTDELIAGEQSIIAQAPLETMPLFVRAGAIIPLAPVVNYVGEKGETEITLRAYTCGQDCRGELYWDDGSSFAYQKGHYLLWRFHLEIKGTEARFSVQQEGLGNNPYVSIILEILGIAEPNRVASTKGSRLDWEWQKGTLRVKLHQFVNLIIS